MATCKFDAGVENEDEDEGSEWNWGGRTGTIFLIDAAKEMFHGNSEEEYVPFKQALKCAYSTITRTVFYSDGDLTGVVLFNTQKSFNNHTEFFHIYILQDLDRPGSEIVLKLEEVIEVSDEKFEEEYGHTSNISINEALWVCRNMFSKCKSKLATRSVLIFTSNDDPHSNAPQKAQQARQIACYMRDIDITIELVQIGQHFDVSKLYKDLILDEVNKESQPALVLADSTCRLDELQNRVCHLEHKQRTTRILLFKLAPGIEMSVSIYTSFTKNQNPLQIKLLKTTNEEVHMVRKEYLVGTGELLKPSDYIHYQSYGERKIKFKLEETCDMKKLYDQGMQLLGFKPIKTIKPYYHIRTSNFIYPDEKNIQGSTKLFSALLDRCKTREVAAIVRLVSSKSAVAWAALIPQMEERADNNCQIASPGFHVCYLPFADDFCDIEIQNRSRATPDQVDAAKEVMKKVFFRYSSDNFENPDLQTHWRNIEALALNKSQVEKVKDYTVPNYDQIDIKAGRHLKKLTNIVFPPNHDPGKAKKTSYSSFSAAPKAKPIFSRNICKDKKKCFQNNILTPPLTPTHKSIQNMVRVQNDDLGFCLIKDNNIESSDYDQRIFPGKLSSVVFDLETNGLKRKYHNIIQISALDVSDISSKMFNAYICPSSESDPRALAVNGFYMQNGYLSKNGKELITVAEKKATTCFLDWLRKRNGKCILIAHNGKRFDVPRLLDLVKKHNLFDCFMNIVHGFVDTLKLFKSIHPHMDNYTQPHLVKMFLNVDYEAHDGIEDVIALAKLITHKSISDESIISNIDQTPLLVNIDSDKLMKESTENNVSLYPFHVPNVTAEDETSLTLNSVFVP